MTSNRWEVPAENLRARFDAQHLPFSTTEELPNLETTSVRSATSGQWNLVGKFEARATISMFLAHQGPGRIL